MNGIQLCIFVLIHYAMKQVTVKIKDSKFKFVMELLRNFDFVQVVSNEGDSKEAISNNIKEGIEEANRINKGETKAISAQDFLNEL